MTSPTEDSTTRDLIFDFIVHYKRDHDGNSPSTREIAEACHLSSTSTVKYHLLWLDREDRLRILDERRYTIQILGATWEYETAPDTKGAAEPTGQDSQVDADLPHPHSQP